MRLLFRNERNEVRKKIKDKNNKLYQTNPTRKRVFDYAKYYNEEAVRENIILYEAFFGRGILCNCNGLFQEFIKRNDFTKYEHIWVLDDIEGNAGIIKEYEKYKNVIFVKYLSDKYLRYLASAKILVNNATFPNFFTKKEEQVYINTWHGIPLKTLGYDQVNGNIETANVIRNLLATDYLLSPCDYQTEIYRKAFKLDGIFEGSIVVEGQPRNDLLINGNREETIGRMRRLGVNIDPAKKIILYAPTWKGQNYGAPVIDVDSYFEFILALESTLPLDEYQILVKPHQVVYLYIKDDERVKGQFVPAILDANEVLSVTDILVSDYSSIYFDFLLTGRPVLFYIPDVDEYKDYRGLYLPLEDLPGPATKKLSDLSDWILSIGKIQEEYHQKYSEQKEKFTNRDDGVVGKKIWEIVLGGNKELDNFHIISGLKTEKKKILGFIGDIRVNGIIESFYSLLKAIDYDKFDVSVFLIPNTLPAIIKKIDEINPDARVLAKCGFIGATLEESNQFEMLLEYSLDDPNSKDYYSEEFFFKEYRRNFGDAKFDYIVNFTGYSGFYSILFLQAKGAKKFIWQHNDLYSDKNKVVKGSKPNEKPLNNCISTYPYYDKVVSCSESVMHVNRKYLATEETYKKYTYSKNFVNFERVFAGLEDEKNIILDGESYIVQKEEEQNEGRSYTLEGIPYPQKETMNFVTMGRMSPEKNHKNMILAFARFHREYPNSKLYLLGDGPLMPDMKALLRAECCIDAIGLLGNVENPFAFMKHCDCFLLPSIHEGQPMVILEARAMGLPIIVSDFSTVTDSLIEDGQLLIKPDIDSIYNGFIAFAKGKVPKVEFDYNKYNREAYMEFERLFDEEV